LHLAAIEVRVFRSAERDKKSQGEGEREGELGGSWFFSLKGKERVFRQRGERKHTLPGGNG